MSVHNKYKKEPQYIVDLHGMTREEAHAFLEDYLYDKAGMHIRIITGKGIYRNGPILQQFVQDFLKKKGATYTYAKLYDGGEGALEVFLA